jgi:monomeric isocitrate dehydrogenase
MSNPAQLFQLLFSSEIKGDLLVLFHKNPGLMDTFEGVARRIGRAGKAIDSDVRDLVTLGILRTRQVGAQEIVYFDTRKDKETQQVIVDYLKTLKPNPES